MEIQFISTDRWFVRITRSRGHGTRGRVYSSKRYKQPISRASLERLGTLLSKSSPQILLHQYETVYKVQRKG